MQRHSFENLPIRWWIQLFQTNVKSHIFTKKSIWRWTTNGEYTAKSAYNAQFFGSYSQFKGKYIWKAEVEGKHKFFAWLLVQSKILTADKLVARQWPCNTVCSLYMQSRARNNFSSDFALQLRATSVEWGGKLDTSFGWQTWLWFAYLGLMGGGVGAAVQESKENQGSGDDLHRMEYLEGEESASLRSKVYLTIRGAAGDQEWDHGKEVVLCGARVIFYG